MFRFYFRLTDDAKLMTPKFLSYLQPDAKMIVILRNPVAATYSAYKFSSERSLASPAHFDGCVKKSASMFLKCVGDYTVKKCVIKMPSEYAMEVPPMCISVFKALLQGHYHVFLEEWMQYFRRDNFYITATEHYSRGTRGNIQRVWQFLGLRDQPGFTINGISSTPSENTAKISIGDMLPVTRELLEKFFRDSEVALVELLGDNDFKWYSPSPLFS